MSLRILVLLHKMAYATRSKQSQSGKGRAENASSTNSRNLLSEELDNMNLADQKDSKSAFRRVPGPTATNKYSRYSTSSPQPSPAGAIITRPARGRGKQTARVARKPQNAVVAKPKGILAPEGYTVRPVIPAEKAELLSVARAMNREEFAPRVKKLFDPEREAALDAIRTGIYIGWRCPSFKWDCIRVSKNSKCFCGHLLAHHSRYTGQSVRVPCTAEACSCKAFVFVPSRPEDVGEFWFQRRRNFDPSTWRAKCKCKHTHEEHLPTGSRRCRAKGCGCLQFWSNFLCAACDKHWEEHETVFETESMRREAGIPFGKAYLPFHELPQLRDVVLTGREDDDSHYRALTSGPFAIPDDKPTDLALQLRGCTHSKNPSTSIYPNQFYR